MNFLILFFVLFIVLGLGGGGFYLLYLKTRPKKETWNAKIYLLCDSVKEPIIKNGKIVSDLRLKDIKPYATDIIEKLEKEPGITIYNLQRLKRAVPPIEDDVIDYWGVGKNEVNLLKIKDTYVILKKGYDYKTGSLIFSPMPASKLNLVKCEIALRKNRLQKDKDILQAITPWIVVGISMLALIGLTYILVSGFVDISENLRDAEMHHSDNMLRIEQGRNVVPVNSVAVSLGVQERNDTGVPVVDGG